MKLAYQVVMVTAVVSAALLLAPASGLGQVADERASLAQRFEDMGRQITVFDREGNVVNTIGAPDMYSQPVFSPDRTHVAVIRRDFAAGTQDLWVFDLATGKLTRITSSRSWESVHSPVWSPDGSQIAYVTVRGSYYVLYRQTLDGEGEEELLYQHPGGMIMLADWSLDGRFLSFYSAGYVLGGQLYLLPLDGDGQAIEVARSESTMVEARLSPDSRFLAYRSDETGRAEIFVRSVALSGGSNASVDTWQVSTEGGVGMASWRRDGQELYYFAADRGVMAVEVNTAEGFEFSQPRRLFEAPVAMDVKRIPGAMAMGFRNGFGNVSRDGQRFVFAVPPPRLAENLQQITVLDRDGNVVSRVGEPGLYSEPVFSPDGSRVAVMRGDLETGNMDVWTFDVSTGEGVPVISDDFQKWALVWSPDGAHVAYSSTQANNDTGIYRKAWNGEGSEELLFPAYAPGAEMALEDYSADGRFLSFESGEIVLVVPLTGTDPMAREPIEFVREEFRARGGWFSPDSRFIAYRSDESGRWEVWVRSFDASSGTAPAEETWQVTEDGARLAFWRQDGKEIIYVTRDRERMDSKVMAVDVTTTPEFQIGTPRLLFRVRDLGEDIRWMMDVRADGQRFVFTMPVAAGTPAP